MDIVAGIFGTGAPLCCMGLAVFAFLALFAAVPIVFVSAVRSSRAAERAMSQPAEPPSETQDSL